MVKHKIRTLDTKIYWPPNEVTEMIRLLAEGSDKLGDLAIDSVSEAIESPVGKGSGGVRDFDSGSE